MLRSQPPVVVALPRFQGGSIFFRAEIQHVTQNMFPTVLCCSRLQNHAFAPSATLAGTRTTLQLYLARKNMVNQAVPWFNASSRVCAQAAAAPLEKHTSDLATLFAVGAALHFIRHLRRTFHSSF